MASETPSALDKPHDIITSMGGKGFTDTLQPPGTLEREMDTLNLSDSAAEVGILCSNMQQRCRQLLEELEKFQSRLNLLKRENSVELRTFKSGLQAEMKLLNKLAHADQNDPKTAHSLRSSNFSFYASVWSAAKFCTSLTALGKRFYWRADPKSIYFNGKVSTHRLRRKRHSALADIVCQDGLEWIKVSNITEKRIIWDLAKAGWVGDTSDEESEDDNQPLDEDEDDPQGLWKQVEALVKASRATRVRYQNPKVRLILPRIKATPDAKEVANVLKQIRDLGVTIQTSEDIPLEAPAVPEVLERMASDRFETFSDVLNIDCTVLLAFASDLSHGRVEPADWHNKAVSRQIEMESEDQLLPHSLWPACGTKKMVCTRDAAVRMQEIVDIIGTGTERRRASLMLSLNNTSPISREALLGEFQKLSDYPVPSEWQLPIQVVDADLTAVMAKLPAIADKVSETLTSINRSVFLYGWSHELTTISSNRTVAKEIESTIEKNRVDENTTGPDIWLCLTSRSLVGKEKQRRGVNGHEQPSISIEE